VEELLFSVIGHTYINDFRQIEIHRAEPLVSGHSYLEVEIAIVKLKKYKLPASDQVLAELMQAGAKHSCVSSINSLILFGISKNHLISGRSHLLYQFAKRVIKL
jgi:hypothetical protein